jgi:hypothetical protein
MMFVKLGHRKNPDLPGGYWQPPVDSGRTIKVPVETLADASRAVREYITRNGLGGGNFRTAPVIDERGRKVAEASFNGRIWDLDGKPVETGAPGGDA